MKRRYSLKRNKEFRYVYRVGKSVGSRSLVLVYAKNRVQDVRIGLSVRKKLGNSVVRNRVKRRLRAALMPLLPYIRAGYHLVFIAKQPAVEEGFLALQDTLRYLIKKAGLLSDTPLRGAYLKPRPHGTASAGAALGKNGPSGVPAREGRRDPAGGPRFAAEANP